MVKIIGNLAAREPIEPSAQGGGAEDRHVCPYPDDAALARRALDGSAEARRQFAERMRCVPRYLATMNLRLGHPFSDHELEDLMQETLVELWRRLDSFEGLASLQTWSWRFCQHVLSSRLRGIQRRPRRIGIDDLPPSAARVETTSLDFEHVYDALDRIDERDAAIVRLRHFDQMTFEQIGRRMGMPESSAKAAYHRALARLRTLLESSQREETA